MRCFASCISAFILCAIAGPAGGAPPPPPHDAAHFGGYAWLQETATSEPAWAPAAIDGDAATIVTLAKGSALEVHWEQPRDLRAVRLVGINGAEVPRARVEYWYSVWPGGRGGGGWSQLDDPWKGRWVAAAGAWEVGPGEARFEFAPLSSRENPDIQVGGFLERRTYKVRVVAEQDGVAFQELRAETDAAWHEARLHLDWKPMKGGERWKGKLEVRNGELLSVEQGGPGNSVRIALRYTETADPHSADRGRLVVRGTAAGDAFSVFPADVLGGQGMYIRDVDAFLTGDTSTEGYEQWCVRQASAPGTTLQRVAALPEQTLTNAVDSMPVKPGKGIQLGLPAMRQEFTIMPNGDPLLREESLRSPGLDRDRRPWDVSTIHYNMAFGPAPGFAIAAWGPDQRRLLDGFLPVVLVDRSVDGVAYRQQSAATMLDGNIPADSGPVRGDEPLALATVLEVQNTTSDTRTAHLWLEISFPVPLRVDEDGLLILDRPSDAIVRPGLTPVRGRLIVPTPGTIKVLRDYQPPVPGSANPDMPRFQGPREVIRVSMPLEPGETRTLGLVIPYIELLDSAQLQQLAALDPGREIDKVAGFWRNRLSQGMQADLPEPTLDHLFRANLWHSLLSTDKDPATGLYEHGAATMEFQNYANETCMVARLLEMRGEHTEALRILRPFWENQGRKALPGNFSTQEGVFYAAYPGTPDPYTSPGYNMHHGFVLAALAEHALWTSDEQYRREVTPALVSGADWIINQVKRTRVLRPDGSRPIEYGLAPAGSLEDVGEYHSWYATNGYYLHALHEAALAILQTNPQDASRIEEEAAVYQRDLLESLDRATAEAAVVPLRDGTWVPLVPARVGAVTARQEGWIREALYPALHLVAADVLKPGDRRVGWMLDHLEDNLYLSSEAGLAISEYEAHFFSWGGMTLQPTLLPAGLIHLRRGERKAFARTLFNTTAATSFDQVACLTEWIRQVGYGEGPIYKTPDEARLLEMVRRALIDERGDELHLAAGLPGSWLGPGDRTELKNAATLFGTMAKWRMESGTSGWNFSAVLPTRNPPAKVILHLPTVEGRPVQRALLDGKPLPIVDGSVELPVRSGEMEVRLYADR